MKYIIAQNMKRILNQKDIKIKDLQKTCGLSFSCIIKILNAKSNIRLSTAIRLCQALSISLEELTNENS